MSLNNNINDLLNLHPFKISSHQKREKLIKIIKLQIEHHAKNCREYKNWYDNNAFLSPNKIIDFADIPFLPSSVFKHINLSSVIKTKSKVIRSSGTISGLKSKINIDASTSINQRRSLSKILVSLLGKNRKIFYILDAKPEADINAGEINARNAGMQGYMIAAKSIKYLLIKRNEELILDRKVFTEMKKNSSNPELVLIGYTYMFWKHIANNKDIKHSEIPLKNKIKLIHFGGWKRLSDLRINKKKFLKTLIKKLNINLNYIFDIYGFTEQLGTIYPAKGLGNCKVSAYSHVLVRDANTLKVLPDGKKGFLQFISPLPLSYPGFSLLNDDMGQISKRTNGKNSYEELEFKVFSRLNKAISRGCGDTLPETYYI